MKQEVSAKGLLDLGLLVVSGETISGSMTYERPAWVYDPRIIRDSYLGAFTLINGQVTTSIYRCRIGRYGQIGEGVVLGPPDHPTDWFSTHPFSFTRERYQPRMYQLPDFRELASDDSEDYSFAETLSLWTHIGHEAYVGAGSFVKRGIRIGDGAVIGAGSVVTRDIPPYAIAVGAPARVVRLRFRESVVERMLALRWWRFNLAPHKHKVNFSKAEATLDYFEQRCAEGTLEVLSPDTYRVTCGVGNFRAEKLAAPLY